MKIFVEKIRLEKGMTTRELERRSKVTHSHILKMERGETNPSLKVMCKIAEALNVPCCELFSCDEYCDKVKEVCKPMNIR